MRHRIPVVADIAGGAPRVAIHLSPHCSTCSTPYWHKLNTIGRPGCASASPILRKPRACGVHLHLCGAAPVVLQVIESPFGIRLRVLFLVLKASLVTGAGLGPGEEYIRFSNPWCARSRRALSCRGICCSVNIPVDVAFAFPGVVDVDVNVSGILHAGGHLVGGFAHNLSDTLSANLFQLFHPIGGVFASPLYGTG